MRVDVFQIATGEARLSLAGVGYALTVDEAHELVARLRAAIHEASPPIPCANPDCGEAYRPGDEQGTFPHVGWKWMRQRRGLGSDAPAEMVCSDQCIFALRAKTEDN